MTLSGPNGFFSPSAPLVGFRGQPVTVHYETADGTATAGVDYTPSSGNLTFDPTEPVTTLSVPIAILPDAIPDNGEAVLVNLSVPVNGVLARGTGTMTITDSSSQPGYVPLTPERLLDTRDGTGVPVVGFVPAGSTTAVQVGGVGDVAATAKAVVLNVTVTEPTNAGFVTAYPCGLGCAADKQPELRRRSDHSQSGGGGAADRWQGVPVHLGEDSSDRRCQRKPPDRLRTSRRWRPSGWWTRGWTPAVTPAVKLPAGSTLQVHVAGEVRDSLRTRQPRP